MKISFVIPAYNEENYLGKCLDSVFAAINQKKYDAEVIVVNNASTDRTREIALSYPGVRVVDEPKKGISRARQAGFLASTGDLIANVDSDTELPSDWIETVLIEFTKDQNLVGLSGPFLFIGTSILYNAMVRFFYSVGYCMYLVNRFLLNKASMLQGGNYVIRRSALEKIDGFDVAYDFYGEDAAMARRLHPLGAVKFTFALPIYASNRRLAREGIVTMGLRYGANYLWTVFLKRPFTKKQEKYIR